MRFSSLFACAAALLVPCAAAQAQQPAGAGAPGGIAEMGKTLWASLTSQAATANWTALDAEIPGVVRLTDATYESVFEESEPQDVWIVLVHGKDSDPISKAFLDIQKNASLLFDEERESAEPRQPSGLSAEVNFKFARVDYFEEYHLCTRWLIFRAPIMAIVTDRGSVLRFVKPNNISPTGEFLYKALSGDHWREVPVWEGSLRPGGSNGWIIEKYLWAMDEWTRLTKDVPKVVWLLLMPTVGQFIMTWLHSGNQPQATGPQGGQRAPQDAKTE